MVMKFKLLSALPLIALLLLYPSITATSSSDKPTTTLYHTDPAYADTKPLIRVGVVRKYHTDKSTRDSRNTSFFLRLFEVIAGHEGWTLQYVDCEWADCMHMLQVGGLDLLPEVASSPQRASLMDFHQTPVMQSWSQLYAAPTAGLKSVKDLHNKRIAVLTGSLQESNLPQQLATSGIKFTLVGVANIADLFSVVQQGDADAAAVNAHFGYLNSRNFDLVETPITFNQAEIFFAAGKNRHQHLLATLDSYLQQWKRDPGSTYYTLFNQVVSQPAQPQRLSPVLKLSITLLGIGLVLAAAMMMLIRHAKTNLASFALLSRVVTYFDGSGATSAKFFKSNERADTDWRQRVNHSFQREDILNGLAAGEFELRYQPQFNLVTKQVSGVEALIYWRRPGTAVLGPAEFIPLAEKKGVVHNIDIWVMQTACQQITQWDRLGLHIPKLAVNLSPCEFDHNRSIDNIIAVLQQTGIDAERLVLEITESMLVTTSAAVLRRLRRLKQLGISLAMDDFGTGYSNLAQLGNLPINCLKIDKSLTHTIDASPQGESILTSIISLADTLNLQLITEGIETQSQYDFLLNAGCLVGQGYLFSKPLNADELFAFCHALPVVDEDNNLINTV